MPNPTTTLRTIKLVHTVVWAFFAGCILAIPVLAWRNLIAAAWWLSAVVLLEVLVLAMNRLRCPLTAVAARYTPERQDNFDIYLPLWLARYNKEIFGSAYVLGVLYTLAAWRGWL